MRVPNKAKDKKNQKTVTIYFNNKKATCKIDNVYIVLALFNYYIFIDNLFLLSSIKAKPYINILP